MRATCLLFLTISCATLTQGTGYAVPSSWLMKKSLGRCRSAGFQPAIPLGSSKAGKTPALQRVSRRLFHQPASPASQPTSSESSANTASGHPFDPGQRDAAPADDRRHQTGGKASHEQRDHSRASDPNHPPSRARLTKVNRPQQLPNARPRFIPGNAMNLHQQGSDKSGGAARSGFIRNETVNIALAVRTPSVVRPTVPALNNVRHRSPNLAVVGGSPNSHSSNTGAINGTRMNRKP
jgi:hypothetical protein